MSLHPPSRLHARGALYLLVIAALFVVVIRACLQSITLDEAGSFLGFALKPWPSHWYPSSDNHVLNSILMRFAATVFGPSSLTARLPAVLGAIIYIGSALHVCITLTSRRPIQQLCFICLVFNPMILDYLVAARGYSLAIAFFLAAIAVIASAMMADDLHGSQPLRKKAMYVSILLALSCAANFSFSIANGTTLGIFALWAITRTKHSRAESIKIAFASLLPGLLVGFILCGSVIYSWPKGQLYFGSKDLSEMWSGFAAGVFDEVNPHLVNPLLIPWFTWFQRALPFMTIGVGLLLLGLTEASRWRRLKPSGHLLGNFVRAMVAVSAVTLTLHWLAFKIIHIPLPKDRTGLFFLPLWTLAFIGSLLLASTFKVWAPVRWSAAAVSLTVAFYFVGCLRLAYFKEWKFDSDTKTLYWIVDDLHRRCGIEKFGIDWRYHSSINFYREEYKNNTLSEFFAFTGGPPIDRTAYVIFFPTSEEFIKQQKLQVIYHNDESGSVVAIRACDAERPTG